jgi:hypothetical protein
MNNSAGLRRKAFCGIQAYRYWAVPIFILYRLRGWRGKKISDKLQAFDGCLSGIGKTILPDTLCRKKNRIHKNQIFKPVDYKAGDIKTDGFCNPSFAKVLQIWGFRDLQCPAFLFNITAEEVKGEFTGILKTGIGIFCIKW